MAKQPARWKPGRGKLGPLGPLLGTWVAKTDSPMGPLVCTRTFRPVLGGTYVELSARWAFSSKAYEEHAIYGVRDGTLSFWSFTSDGKRSEGKLTDGSDVHPDAVAFEADMPAGVARMIYWPGEDGTICWAVEAKGKKGWRRFTEHTYRPGKPPRR